ncbi:hypothetical protein [Mesorhizobium retamae]|uniref:RiboL-PSP-HEPN domain-containing protein n=1 Tax=Mesorhizobium retamae TaxID=2912854 RepID=A0ABS9QBG8_9HYPH|nr:hypothetical protein [Mesorhizobium sp. IRAMC:0171]MCG7504767.1 hypothetical protein [Mesorhizobium sp. IRAMC:0171]
MDNEQSTNSTIKAPRNLESFEVPYFPKDDLICSRPLYLFLHDHSMILDHFLHTINLAATADKVQKIASRALNKIDNKAMNQDDENEEEEFSGENFKRLKDRAYISSKNLLTGIIDSFLWYISEIIQESMKRKPEIVKSGQTIKIEELFLFKKKRDLINHIVEQKVHSLSYKGIDEIEKFISDSLGVDMFVEKDDKDYMKQFIETRNIYVHNRGIADRVFVEKMKYINKTYTVGKRISFDYEKLALLSNVCAKTANNIDEKISLKFGIERKKRSTWKKNAKPVGYQD